MRFNTLLTIFSVIAMGDGVVAILAPGHFSDLLWPHRTGPEAYLFIQGWGSCYVALSLMAWLARSVTDAASRRLFALGFFAYHCIAAILLLVDAFFRGWTLFSAATFVGLVLFALGFGYFRFVNSAFVRLNLECTHATN